MAGNKLEKKIFRQRTALRQAQLDTYDMMKSRNVYWKWFKQADTLLKEKTGKGLFEWKLERKPEDDK